MPSLFQRTDGKTFGKFTVDLGMSDYTVNFTYTITWTDHKTGKIRSEEWSGDVNNDGEEFLVSLTESAPINWEARYLVMDEHGMWSWNPNPYIPEWYEKALKHYQDLELKHLGTSKKAQHKRCVFDAKP